MVVCVLLGMVLGFFLIWAQERLLGEVKVFFLLLVAVFFVCLFLHVILHELGHLLFGLWTGYRFSSFRVFNFMWVKTDGKTHFKKLSIAGTAGQCLLLPPPQNEGKIPTVWYNLGGVIVNFFVSALCIVFAVFLQNAPIPRFCLAICAATGLIFGLTNGIPMRVGQVDNDGKNALSLRKNEKAAYAFWLQLQINGTLASGKRLRDMPPEWFDLPPSEEWGNSMIATRAVFCENYYMDRKEFSKAKALASRLLEEETGIVDVHANLLRCDLVYLALVVDGALDEAEGLWGKELVAFQKTMKNFPAVLRTQYAYALFCDRDEEKAATLYKRFKKIEKSYPYEADIQGERELMTLAQEGYAAQTAENTDEPQ